MNQEKRLNTMNRISRDAALELLKKYNKDSLIERGASQPG